MKDIARQVGVLVIVSVHRKSALIYYRLLSKRTIVAYTIIITVHRLKYVLLPLFIQSFVSNAQL